MHDEYQYDMDASEADNDYTYTDYEDYHDLAAYTAEESSLIIMHRINTHDACQELSRLATSCMGTVLLQAYDQVKVLFLLCFLFRIICYFMHCFRFNYDKIFYSMHFLSCVFGFCIMYNMFYEIFKHMAIVVFILIIITYLSNTLLSHYSKCGLISALITVLYILFTEVIFSDPEMWNRIRGVLLMVSMKIISISIDMDKKNVTLFPNVLEYFSYCLNPGTLVFGPWISLQQYRDSIFLMHSLSFEWVYYVTKRFVQSVLCLVLSMCVLSYLFLNPLELDVPFIMPFVANSWMLSYENAISFHFSHYYVSYLSTATCLVSGIGAVKENVKRDEDDKNLNNTNSLPQYTWSKFEVTRPLSIEVPRSMPGVTVAWNIPMSKWLKMYVFDTARYFGNFSAVLFTYAASALLHGLSFHLAAVLLSLGFYTYTEHTLRLKLSKIFNCPHIQARPKRSSNDSQQIPIWARLFNLLWIFINLMHLAYLGSMFQSEEDETDLKGYSIAYTLSKWSQLGYTSHLFALACFTFSWLI